MAKEVTASQAKLIQYLNEAYGKEKELETSLTAHISMTTKAPYRKRLQDHLKETKRHGREVQKRIKALGGKAEATNVPDQLPDAVGEAATAATGLASRAVAAAKGPLHMIRGTGEAEKMLKNATTEYMNEYEEIARYTSIETLATAVNDKETAQLAKSIRREEERMAKFLEKQIPQLTKAVAQEEIPASERRSSSRRSRSSSSRRSSSSSRSSSGGGSSRSSGSSSSRSGGSSRAKSGSSRSKSGSSRAKSNSSRAKSSSSRAKSSSSRSRSSSGRSSARSSGSSSRSSGSSRSRKS